MWQAFLEKVFSLEKKLRFSLGRERAILLICMGIALLFWVFTKLSKTYETARTFSLDYNLPLGMLFREPPPSELKVTLRASGWSLMSSYLFKRRSSVVFDLSAVESQEIERSEIISRIEENVSVEVTGLNRNHLSLQLDKTASKKVAIELDADLNFSPDFNLRNPVEMTPDSVMVYGPENLLNSITVLRTEPLQLDNPEQDFKKTLKIINPEPQLLQLSDSQTSVFLPVEQFTEKSFKVPILVTNVEDSVRIIPSVAELKCVVGLSHYDNLDETDFVVEANFENIVNFREQNTVPLVLTGKPEWVRSVFFSPASVEYLIIQ